MTFGPAPWQQTNWDWRAAGNFICGGAGAGLIVFTVLSGAEGLARMLLLLAGMALVGCRSPVRLARARPAAAGAARLLQPAHVVDDARSVHGDAALSGRGRGAAAGVPGFALVAAALALVFVYCQSRMLQAARGIPAWREPLFSPLIVLTGLVEGGGAPSPDRRLAPRRCRAAARALRRARAGPSARLACLPSSDCRDRGAARARRARRCRPGAATRRDGAAARARRGGDRRRGVGGHVRDCLGVAGLAAWITGAYLKYALVTRAGFNQGFALAHLPVRGVRP